MAHFAVLCPDDAGHLLSVGSLGAEMARRGHQVTLVARKKAAPIADQLGLQLQTIDANDIPWPNAILSWVAFSMFGAEWKIVMRRAFCWQTEVLLQLLPPVLKKLKVDGLIVDQTYAAGGTVADLLEIPYITVCSALPWNQEDSVPPPFTDWPYEEGGRARRRNRRGYASWHWYIRPALKIINRYRREAKLPTFDHIDQTYSSLAQLCQLCPEIDFPHEELPAEFHYVGPLGANRPRADSDFP